MERRQRRHATWCPPGVYVVDEQLLGTELDNWQPDMPSSQSESQPSSECNERVSSETSPTESLQEIPWLGYDDKVSLIAWIEFTLFTRTSSAIKRSRRCAYFVLR
jgi:hypothetical protein